MAEVEAGDRLQEAAACELVVLRQELVEAAATAVVERVVLRKRADLDFFSGLALVSNAWLEL